VGLQPFQPAVQMAGDRIGAVVGGALPVMSNVTSSRSAATSRACETRIVISTLSSSSFADGTTTSARSTLCPAS
jgi:hypothetical protein